MARAQRFTRDEDQQAREKQDGYGESGNLGMDRRDEPACQEHCGAEEEIGEPVLNSVGRNPLESEHRTFPGNNGGSIAYTIAQMRLESDHFAMSIPHRSSRIGSLSTWSRDIPPRLLLE